MQTLYDFGMKVMEIRNAVEGLTVKGHENAGIVKFIFDECTGIIRAINEISAQMQNPPENQNEANPEETEANDNPV